MGPAEFITEGGIDVRPHPHIGLGTVTYLYQGEFQHRDSLGTNQMIHPGAVNWMLAGRGVTHSERTSAETRKTRHKLFGIQTWVALPEDREDMAPDFEHHGKDALPFLDAHGAQSAADPRHRLGRARAGEPCRARSSMPMSCSPPARRSRCRTTTRIAASTSPKAQSRSRARPSRPARMMVFRPGDRISVRAGAQGARLMALGGETL
jgi:redox-sensitive bicupin YhaK (pirin superfamily)